MRVLVVDDEVTVVSLIRQTLSIAGYDVISAPNGAEALKILAKEPLRMVISDWRMPGMSGPELCRAVRGAKFSRYIYLILLTAFDGAQERIDGFSSGADDFVRKPFHPAELVARVRAGERVLNAERAELQAEITMRRHMERELVTQRQQLEQTNADLKKSNEKLSELYQTAQRFVDNVSHEFRTPLTVIKGYAEAVGDGMAGPVNQRQKEFLGYVVDRTRDLAQMVDDLLDTSKLRAGTLRVDRAPQTLEDILQPVRPILKAKAAMMKVAWEEDIDSDLPVVIADAEKVGRVLLNLAVNAIKFSPEGGRVTLWARRQQGPGGGNGVEVGVTDHGPGISPENLAVVFDRFQQLGQGRNKNKGFGLGLNIARELVALNLGEICVTSQLGQGSTFSFTLPPNDPDEVLRRYLIYLQSLAEVETTIGAMRIVHLAGSEVPEDVRKYFATTIRPSDLILQTPDGRSLLVIG
jgi:signal transduction histidine kinase